MNTIKIYTGIVKGQPVDQESISNAYRYYEGVAVDITIEKHKTRRSKAQNNYLWGVMWLKIQEHIEKTTGKRPDPKDIHDHYVKFGYFGFKTDPINGCDMPKGSSEANTFEFSQAKERIQREWAERGLVIEDPGQTEFLDEQ